jgi:hypothetical protein
MSASQVGCTLLELQTAGRDPQNIQEILDHTTFDARIPVDNIHHGRQFLIIRS